MPPHGRPSAGGLDDPGKGTDVPETTYAAACTALAASGRPCDNASLPDSPFPICLRHAAEVMRYLNAITEDHAGAAVMAARSLAAEIHRRPEHLRAPGRGVSVVYYLRIGQYIKIGYSADLKTRIRFYPPDTEILALEIDGDRTLEAKRLRQFRHDLLAGTEWFAPSPALLSHIESLATAKAA